MRQRLLIVCTLLCATHVQAESEPAGIDWQRVGHPTTPFEIARTETTVDQFRRFVTANSFETAAEKADGGLIYENGWALKPGWYWQAPYGKPAADDEPAAYVTYDEASAFCQWAGGQLPTDAQWLRAAYTETRSPAPGPFEFGKTYPYPTGGTPVGAHCLKGCGDPKARAVTNGKLLSRGYGHARTGKTAAGVNGLFDMGANLWEWVNEPVIEQQLTAKNTYRRTRGGSWWYMPSQMRADYVESKPGDYAVAYIGFRCARSVRR